MLNSKSKPHGGAVAEPEEEHATVWVRGWNWGSGVRGSGSGQGGTGFRVRCEGLGVRNTRLFGAHASGIPHFVWCLVKYGMLNAGSKQLDPHGGAMPQNAHPHDFRYKHGMWNPKSKQVDPHGGAVAEPEEEHAPASASVGNRG